MIYEFKTYITGYELKDFGAYKTIFISYNDSNIETRYKIDGNKKENISYNNMITVPCTSTKVKFYGVKRGIDATQTITMDLKLNKPSEVNYYHTFDKTIQNRNINPSDIDYNTMYFSDVDTNGYAEEAFPRKTIIKHNTDGNNTIVIVDKLNENRLDFIAQEYLNNPYHWWILAEYNNIVNPFDVPSGTEIKIPDSYELYSRGGALRVPEIKLYQIY